MTAFPVVGVIICPVRIINLTLLAFRRGTGIRGQMSAWQPSPKETRNECWNIRSQDYSFPGTHDETFVLGDHSSLEHTFPGTVLGTKVPGNEWSRERMFQGTNGPGNESSREQMVLRTKVPSWERMFQGTNNLENEYS